MDERINYLLLKFEKGELSKVETDELLELTDQHKSDVTNAIEEMIDAEVPSSSVIDKNNWSAVFENIVSVDKYSRGRSRLIPLVRWVAAATILITLGLGAWFYFETSVQKDTHKSRYANDILPGGNDAVLTLADGSEISLTDAGKGELLNITGVRIVKMADGQVVYSADPDFAGKVAQLNTITTPRGGQYQVNLPDGTRVWLNAASSLKFPTSFTNLKERKVELSGEAYFEVAKNKAQPFKVISSADDYGRAQETEVLGTHFNINAYDDEVETKTTLLEGAVRIAARQNISNKYDVVLSSGQQAVLTNNKIKISTADTEEAVAWKNGNFVFANEKIESIMRKISRWYNVDIVYEGKITDNNFVGTVQRFKNVSEALHILELTKTVHFRIEGRRITVMP